MKPIDYHYVELAGRVHKQRQEQPRKEFVLVRNVLSQLNIRYKETVTFRNPLWNGWKQGNPEALQFLDFVIWDGRGIRVLLFDLNYIPHHGTKPYERAAFEAKQSFLKEKHVPVLIIPRTYTSQLYRFIITQFTRKEAHYGTFADQIQSRDS